MIQTIYGNIPSKSNAYKVVNGRFYKDKRVVNYEKDFAAQWVNKGKISGRFGLVLNVWFQNELSDLDGAFKVVLDLLQEVGAIHNDRDCMVIMAQKHIDKDNPRCIIQIESYE